MSLFGYTLDLYGANEEPVAVAGTEYDTVAVSTLSSLTGYATVAIDLVAPAAAWDINTESFEAESGAVHATTTRRRVFNCETAPYYWDPTKTQDLETLDAISSLFASKKFVWARITTADRSYPSTGHPTPTHAHPVTLQSIDESMNKQQGWRLVTVRIAHKFRF